VCIRLKATFFSFFPSLFVTCLLMGSVLSADSPAQSIGDFPSGNVQTLSRARVLSQVQDSIQIPVFPKDKTVIDMTIKELLSFYPSELRRLEFGPNQDELNTLLEKIGARLQSFFQGFSNTSSKESVFLQKPGSSEGIARDFSYLISFHPNGLKPLLEEYRTDGKNQPVNQSAINGFLITAGYVGLNLNFHPGYQQTCRFRYLGRQTSDPRAYIIAFAQKPEAKDLEIQYTDTITGRSGRVPVQGIAWVDPKTYQILRLRINLLGARNYSFMKEQSTDVKLGEVRFEDTQKKLWLPREVIVKTLIGGAVYRNQHRYQEYRLFDVSSDFTIDQPKIRN
jgi:hypothetical protein